MNEPLEIQALEQLALRFRALEAAPTWRQRLRSRPALLGVVAALVLTGTAGAGVVALTEGPPFPDAPAGDLAPRDRPVPGSDSLADALAPDPAGGPAWGIRVSESETGQRCMAVGRVHDGRVGRIENGEFRELGRLGPSGCQPPLAPGQAFSGRVSFTGSPEPRSVAHGFAAADVDRIEIRPRRAAPITVEPSADGTYIAVFEGLPTLAYTVHFDDGTTQVLDPTSKEPVDLRRRR
jgi:hypothetical protein